MILKNYVSKFTEQSVGNGYGFVILCPEDFPSEASLTISRIRNIFVDPAIRLVISPEFASERNDRYKSLSVPIDIGDRTITGMINLGVSRSKFDWNFVLIAGANVTENLIKKYLYFCREESDFIFPVIDRKWIFADASINGLFYNRRRTPEAPENEPNINLTKAMWGTEILQSGGKLKGIVGGNF